MDPRVPATAQRGRGGARCSLPASASGLPARLLAATHRCALLARDEYFLMSLAWQPLPDPSHGGLPLFLTGVRTHETDVRGAAGTKLYHNDL
jgi:hypothetical protein